MKWLGIFLLSVGLVIVGGVSWSLQDFRSLRAFGSLDPGFARAKEAFLHRAASDDIAWRPATESTPAPSSAQPPCVAVGIGMLADVNDDGVVNVDDIQLVAKRWRDPNQYDILYDVVQDDIINILDIARIAASWGSMCPLHFVDGGGNPLAGATVRVLCYESASANFPLADLLVETNAFGRPIRSLPAGCNGVAALHLRHEQPSGKPGHGPAYQVYATSWPPGTRQLLPVAGTVPIRDGWPLVLFNVVAGLEWEPAPGSHFVDDLGHGLYNASAYLYDLTDGQMALGAVDLRAGGRGWNAADLRFRAANDYRPSAYVGGIVATPLPYTAPMTELETVYMPGEVYLGRFWDGLSASNPVTGHWSQEAAYRTLVHEWAHYALFLYDEYQDIDISGNRAKTYCTCADLDEVGIIPGACGGVTPDLAASAMAYHYTASELWLSGEPPVCVRTDQWQVHGQPDWETLSNWGLIQGLAPDWLQKPPALDPGPNNPGLAGDLFKFMVANSRPATPTVSEVTVTLKISVTGNLNTLYPQVYVLEGPVTEPDRIVYQGTTVGGRYPPDHLGEITLLGVPERAHARVFVDRYSTAETPGGRFVYPLPDDADPPLADGQTLRLEEDPWRASLDVAYDMAGPLLTTMTLTLTSLDPLTADPIAQLCVPDADTGCPNDPAWRKIMRPIDSITWTADFTASKDSGLPHYGVLRVQAPGTGELIRWFQAAGGVGPAHMDAEAPLRDGVVMVDATKSVPGERNRVIVMPAANYDQLLAPLPPGIQEIIGVPLDVDILLPAEQAAAEARGGRSTGVTGRAAVTPVDRALRVPAVLTFFYGQDVIERLGIGEGQLRVLHFSRDERIWGELQEAISNRSDTLGWLASAPVDKDGIYAVGWVASP